MPEMREGRCSLVVQWRAFALLALVLSKEGERGHALSVHAPFRSFGLGARLQGSSRARAGFVWEAFLPILGKVAECWAL